MLPPTHLGATGDCLKLRLKLSRPLRVEEMLASSEAGTAGGTASGGVTPVGATRQRPLPQPRLGSAGCDPSNHHILSNTKKLQPVPSKRVNNDSTKTLVMRIQGQQSASLTGRVRGQRLLPAKLPQVQAPVSTTAQIPAGHKAATTNALNSQPTNVC
jgi:hypothetical protein